MVPPARGNIVAGAQQHLETALLGHDGERNRQRGALDIVVDHGGDAFGLALERDHLVVLAGVHVEEAVQHRLRLVVIGAAGPAETQRLAFEVLRLGDFLPRGDGPLRFERLADDVFDLGAAQRRLRAARWDRRAVEIARQHGGDLGAGLQFDQRDVEPFGFEETLVERDIGRHVEAVAADHLADGDFGLRLGARGRRLARARCAAAIVAARASAIRGIGMRILPVFFDEPRQPRRSENASYGKEGRRARD